MSTARRIVQEHRSIPSMIWANGPAAVAVFKVTAPSGPSSLECDALFGLCDWLEKEWHVEAISETDSQMVEDYLSHFGLIRLFSWGYQQFGSPLKEINQPLLDAFQSSGVSAEMFREKAQHINVLSRFFELLCEAGVLATHPMTDLRPVTSPCTDPAPPS